MNEIDTSEAHCPIYLNQENLVFDLSNEMLLRPTLIDSSHRIITCSCRVHVNKLLNNKNILVHKIHLPDVISEKISIDSLIRTLPISEKVAIGQAIERELGNRRGKRTDLLPHGSSEVNKQNSKELLKCYFEMNRGLETRVIAARIASFSSHFLYGEAKEVTKKGIPPLILAMDNKQVSISKAKQIAQLPKEQQLQQISECIAHTQYLKNFTGVSYEQNSHR